ncbi:unnamed protein product [Protopolystoma xenopodis]|uniref:Uncharacterized protein n=1 Tax=Protopolystoma xenopodis TaxID=117903 RepID=A0A3S5B8M9_9PLAT|nr:unnamed protein product [Protopolystoma xenopodis]
MQYPHMLFLALLLQSAVGLPDQKTSPLQQQQQHSSGSAAVSIGLGSASTTTSTGTRVSSSSFGLPGSTTGSNGGGGAGASSMPAEAAGRPAGLEPGCRPALVSLADVLETAASMRLLRARRRQAANRARLLPSSRTLTLVDSSNIGPVVPNPSVCPVKHSRSFTTEVSIEANSVGEHQRLQNLHEESPIPLGGRLDSLLIYYTLLADLISRPQTGPASRELTLPTGCITPSHLASVFRELIEMQPDAGLRREPVTVPPSKRYW